MMKPMNKWYVDNDYNDNDCFAVLHYVGGEIYIYDYGYYDTQKEADEKTKELNALNIEYGFNCFEGDCELVIEGLEQ